MPFHRHQVLKSLCGNSGEKNQKLFLEVRKNMFILLNLGILAGLSITYRGPIAIGDGTDIDKSVEKLCLRAGQKGPLGDSPRAPKAIDLWVL